MAENSTLSDMDVRILRFLSHNGAQYSDSKIARGLRLSPATVNYKIRKLEDEGVIRGYKYRLNQFKLGYTGVAYCFIVVKPRCDIGFYNMIVKESLGSSISSVGGDFDFVIKFYYRNAQDLNDFLSKLASKVKKDVEKIHTRIVIRPYKTHRVLLNDSDLVTTKLTSRDQKILDYLLKHPSNTQADMAKDLRMHRNTVSSRFRKLFEDKVILKKSVVIDPKYYAEMGTGFTALVTIDAKVGGAKKVGEQLAPFDEIHDLVSIAHPHDLMAIVRTKNMKHCYDFMRSLYKFEDLVKTRTVLVFETTEEVS